MAVGGVRLGRRSGAGWITSLQSACTHRTVSVKPSGAEGFSICQAAAAEEAAAPTWLLFVRGRKERGTGRMRREGDRGTP